MTVPPPPAVPGELIASAARTIRETGGAVEIAGVRIEPCDEYGATETTRACDAALADVERLRGVVASWQQATAAADRAYREIVDERDRAVEAARRDALDQAVDAVMAEIEPKFSEHLHALVEILTDLRDATAPRDGLSATHADPTPVPRIPGTDGAQERSEGRGDD